MNQRDAGPNGSELNAIMASISRQAGKLLSRSISLTDQVNEFRRSVAEVVLRHRRTQRDAGPNGLSRGGSRRGQVERHG